MQPPKATRSRSLLLALAALLALWPAPGSAGRAPQLVGERRLLNVRWSPDPSSLPVRRAAQTAINFFNYQQGSPSTLRAPGPVRKVSVKAIPGFGRKYFLQFATKDLVTGEDLGTCHASVFYRTEKPKPTVVISCSPDKDRVEHLKQDYDLYRSVRGDKEPTLQRLWGLGVYGSSFIAWETSTEDLTYTLKEIKDVKLWKKDDDAPEFDFTVLLGDKWGESSLSCHVRVTWSPLQPVRVKYDCSPEDGSSASADGSGGELGSTDEFFNYGENNV